MVELFGGGSVINGPTPSSFYKVLKLVIVVGGGSAINGSTLSSSWL